MTQICINNGSRAGPIATMTIDECNDAKEEDGSFVVLVRGHKTYTVYGPARIVLSPSLYGYLKIYIEQFRNELPGVLIATKPNVFLSFSGVFLSSSQVGEQMSALWGKVFQKESSIGGATSFRKAAVSAVQEANKDMHGPLADLMVHKQSTADKYYELVNRGKSAVKKID